MAFVTLNTDKLNFSNLSFFQVEVNHRYVSVGRGNGCHGDEHVYLRQRQREPEQGGWRK